MAKNYKYEIPLRQWKRSHGVRMLSRLRRQDCLAMAFQGLVMVHKDGTAVLTREGERSLKFFSKEYRRRFGKLPRV